MFYAISWQEFLWLAAVALIAYYAVTTVLFYRAELAALVKGKRRGGADGVEMAEGAELVEAPEAADLTDAEQPKGPSDPVGSLMGQAKPENDAGHVLSTPADQIRFQPEEAEQQAAEAKQARPVPDVEAAQLSAVTGLLEEIKTLVQVIAECNGSREEATPLFQSLLSRHHHLAKTDYREALTLYLYHTCRKAGFTFHFSLDEIKAWWDSREQASNKQIIHP